MKAGWEVKKLGEVCDLQNGYAFKSNDYVEFSNTLNIRMSSIRPDGSFDSEHNQRFLPDSYASEYKSFLLSDDDLIIAMTDMAGDPKILGVPTLVSNRNGRNFLMNQRVGKLFDFTEQIYVPYLRYFLTSPLIKELYKNKGAGGLQINISKADILSVDVPFSNITEQQRIVAILDQAFEGIAKARANAEQNLKKARALFESYLQSVFTERSKDWTTKSVGELVTDGVLYKPFDGNHGEIHPRKSDFIASGVPFVMASDLVNGEVDTENCNHISKKLADSLRVGFAKNGDVLISHKGTIGRSAIVTSSDEYIMLTPQVTAYRIKDKTQFLNKFIRYYFMSPIFQNEIISAAQDGSTRAYIGITRQNNLKFIFPSLNEQQSIVVILNQLLPETQRLEAIYQRKITLLDELKKSLLQQAFAREL